MYPAKLLFFVNLCVICVKCADSLTVDLEASSKKTFKIAENDLLNIIVDTRTGFGEAKSLTCTSECYVNSTSNIKLHCNVVPKTEKTDFKINVTVNDKITKNKSGNWTCNSIIQNDIQKAPTTVQFGFYLNVVDENDSAISFWIYVGVALVIIVILLFSLQSYFIIHYRKKAKAGRREPQWSNKVQKDNPPQVRYSKMPGRKIPVDESRDSKIYEEVDLSNIRQDNKTSTSEKMSTIERIKNRLPIPTPDESQIYEDVDPNFHQNTRNEVKETGTMEKAGPKRAMEQPHPWQLPKPQPVNAHMAMDLQLKHVPMEQPNSWQSSKTQPVNGPSPLDLQLKLALEKRQQMASPPSTLPKPLPKLTVPSNVAPVPNPTQPPRPWVKEPPKMQSPNEPPWSNGSPLLKPKRPAVSEAIQNHPPMPKPTSHIWATESSSNSYNKHSTPGSLARERKVPETRPYNASMPRVRAKESTPGSYTNQRNDLSMPRMRQQVGIRNDSSLPKQKWQREREVDATRELQRPIVLPTCEPYNPGLPPPDAPPARSRLPPKPTLPPSMVPYQHSQLPSSQQLKQPVVINPMMQHSQESDDSDSEWTYEQLPRFNIYNT